MNDQNSTLQQQLAQAHKDTRTCGELSCDECNERYQKAVAEISALRRQLAEAHKENAALQARATELSNFITPVEKRLEEQCEALQRQLAALQQSEGK